MPDKMDGLNKMDTLICLPANWLKRGKSKAAATMAITNDRKQAIKDSTRNWAIRLFLRPPNTFLTPTSFARLAEDAVERFIKLMQAINKIKMAIAKKIYTSWILPLIPSSSAKWEYKCMSVRGIRLHFI